MLAVFILSLIIKHFYNPVWFDLLIAVIQLIFLYFIVKVPIGEFIFSKGRIKSLIHSYDRIQAYNFTVDIISSIRLFFIIASIITTLIFIKKLINLFVDIIEKL